MHQIRIEYDSFVPTGSGPPLTPLQLVEQRAMARAYHLCSLGFMLSCFDHANNPHKIDGDQLSLSLQSYGLLLQGISEGIFRDIDELLALSKREEVFK